MKHGLALLTLIAVGSASAASPTWKRIAGEEQAFNVGDAARTVRYGAGGSWIEKTITGTGACSNDFFGTDPAPGLRKTCELSSVAPAAPTAPAAKSPGTVQLSWAAPTKRADGTPLSRITGYRVMYGTTSGNYTQSVNVSGTSATISNLASGKYFFVIKAIDAAGKESAASAEVSKTIQ
jgi:hypothetical protein